MSDKKSVVEIYNPANAASLTPEEVAAMQLLTKEEIALLAKEYPNKPSGGTYLVLFDTKKKMTDQLFSRSTWQNLNNLNKQGVTNFKALSFSSIFSKGKSAVKQKIAPVQDLTKDQANNELKAAATTGTEGNENINANANTANAGGDGGGTDNLANELRLKSLNELKAAVNNPATEVPLLKDLFIEFNKTAEEKVDLRKMTDTDYLNSKIDAEIEKIPAAE